MKKGFYTKVPGTSPEAPGKHPEVLANTAEHSGSSPEFPGKHPNVPDKYPRVAGHYPGDPGYIPKDREMSSSVPGSFPKDPEGYPDARAFYHHSCAFIVAHFGRFTVSRQIFNWRALGFGSSPVEFAGYLITKDRKYFLILCDIDQKMKEMERKMNDERRMGGRGTL